MNCYPEAESLLYKPLQIQTYLLAIAEVEAEADKKVLEADKKVLVAEADKKVFEAVADKKVFEAVADKKVFEADKKVLVAEADKKVFEAVADKKVIEAVAKANMYKLRLESSEKERLQVNGLMTSRGILEWLIIEVAKELKAPAAKNIPPNTDVCERVAFMVGKQERPNGDSSLSALYDIFLECGVDTAEKGRLIYKEVSCEIHGYPWSGPGVKVYTSRMNEKSKLKCVIKAVAKYHNLEVIEVSNTEM